MNLTAGQVAPTGRDRVGEGESERVHGRWVGAVVPRRPFVCVSVSPTCAEHLLRHDDSPPPLPYCIPVTAPSPIVQ